MKSVRIITKFKAVLHFIVFAVIMTACDTGQRMMHVDGRSLEMGTWNWLQILISLGIGFLIGYIVARKRS